MEHPIDIAATEALGHRRTILMVVAVTLIGGSVVFTVLGGLVGLLADFIRPPHPDQIVPTAAVSMVLMLALGSGVGLLVPTGLVLTRGLSMRRAVTLVLWLAGIANLLWLVWLIV